MIIIFCKNINTTLRKKIRYGHPQKQWPWSVWKPDLYPTGHIIRSHNSGGVTVFMLRHAHIGPAHLPRGLYQVHILQHHPGHGDIYSLQGSPGVYYTYQGCATGYFELIQVRNFKKMLYEYNRYKDCIKDFWCEIYRGIWAFFFLLRIGSKSDLIPLKDPNSVNLTPDP